MPTPAERPSFWQRARAFFSAPFRARPVALAPTNPLRGSTKPGIGKDKQAGSAVIRSEWTFRKLRAAERQAEAGSMHAAVSICEWLLSDDRISATLSARVEALLGLVPTFEEDEEGAKGKKTKEAQQDFWAGYPESSLTAILMWAIMLGGVPARHNWEPSPEHNNRLLPKPKLWYPQTLEWSWQDRVLSVQDARGVRIVVTPGDGEWLFHAPWGADRFWAYGLWRKIARWVLLKNLAAEEWAFHSAKGGMFVVDSPMGANDDQRQELANAIANAEESPVVVLPNQFKMSLLEKTANTQAIYDAQIKAADEAIAILIRGANLSTNVKGGSHAAAETQKKTGDDAKLRFDAQALTTTLHDQSLVWWATFNFGDPALAPWPKYPVEPEEDMGERATMLVALGDALTKLDTLGYDFDLPKLQDEFGLTFITGRPRETRVPTPAALPGADPKKPGEKTADPKKPAPKKEARALASGATENVEGFHDGQEHIDDVVEETTRVASRELQGELAAILKLVDEAKGLDALSAALAEYYKEQDPEKLMHLVERTLVMANLAGRLAVLQDL